MAGKTKYGVNDRREPAKSSLAVPIHAIFEADEIQLLAANLESADPDVFNILQRVRLLRYSSTYGMEQD